MKMPNEETIMNYFCKHYLWFVPLCIAVVWGICTAQLVSGQSEQIDSTSSPTRLTTTTEATVPPATEATLTTEATVPPTREATLTTEATVPPTKEATLTTEVAPTIEATLTTEAAPTTEATPSGEDGENKILRWNLIGMIVVAVLLLVAIGIYLLLNSRRQAKLSNGGVLPPPPTNGQPYLTSNGRSFPITTFPFTIGRGESNNLIIDETFPQWESMSRIHAQIVQHQQGYVIEDLGSQNKLRVQGRLTDRNLLRNGWQILIGGVAFTFFDGSSTPGGSA